MHVAVSNSNIRIINGLGLRKIFVKLKILVFKHIM